jgi:hypothetical protein
MLAYQTHENQIHSAFVTFITDDPRITMLGHPSPSGAAQRPKALAKKSRSTIN